MKDESGDSSDSDGSDEEPEPRQKKQKVPQMLENSFSFAYFNYSVTKVPLFI